jgi:ribosomal protein S18 acetylase RimI-like enzyme
MKHLKEFKLFESKPRVNESEVEIVFCDDYNEYEELVIKLKNDPDVTYRFGEYHKEFCLDKERHINDPSWRCFLVKFNGQKVGTIGYFQMLNVLKSTRLSYSSPTRDQIDKSQRYIQPNEYWMGWFVILPEFRGTGIAQIAVSKLRQEIKRANPKSEKLLLNTEWDNYQAHKFYKKVGFDILSDVGEYCKNLDINIHDHFTFPEEELIFYQEI